MHTKTVYTTFTIEDILEVEGNATVFLLFNDDESFLKKYIKNYEESEHIKKYYFEMKMWDMLDMVQKAKINKGKVKGYFNIEDTYEIKFLSQ